MKERLDEIWQDMGLVAPNNRTIWSLEGGDAIAGFGLPVDTYSPEPPDRRQLSLFKRVGNREVFYTDLTPGGTNLTTAL
jgi:hypothetical protein